MINKSEVVPSADFAEIVPSHLSDVVMTCALPHWFDADFCIAMIRQTGTEALDSDRILAELLRLPFVYSHTDGVWQYTASARAFYLRQLLSNETLSQNAYLLAAKYFRDRWEKASGGEARPEAGHMVSTGLEWVSRQLQLHLAYHLAPLDPAEAIERLLGIAEWAGSDRRRFADHKLAVDVWLEQRAFLAGYVVEGAYLEGRYAYAKRDLITAEKKFVYVWDRGAHKQIITARAGHLLGVIWRQSGNRRLVEESEFLLRDTLAICEGRLDMNTLEVRKLTSRVLNSLGATLVQLGGAERLQEAEHLLHQSMKMHEELADDFGTAHVLNSLATLYVRSGKPEKLNEAESLLRKAILLCQTHGSDHDLAVMQSSLANVLMQMDGERHNTEAQSLLRSSLRIGESSGDEHLVALVVNRLGVVLMRKPAESNLLEAERFFRRSLQLWQKRGNIQGQIEVTENLARLLEQTGRAADADRLRQEIIGRP